MSDGGGPARAFVAAVCDEFAIADSAASVVVEPMVGSANRLWRFASNLGAFVVKELSHDDPDEIDRRLAASAFERSVFEQGSVVMAEPLASRSGAFVLVLPGSRDVPSIVRVHRWIDGSPVRGPDERFVDAAGRLLAAVQTAGRGWSTQPAGYLQWWEQSPDLVLDRLVATPELQQQFADAGTIVADALDVVVAGEQLPGAWVYTHCDHKPENALRAGDSPVLLDWDECGHCHPRVEAVEAALRWAGGGMPDRALFVAFLRGYEDESGSLGSLGEHDFAKWVAALLGWFSFQARRALSDWPTDTAEERHAAAMVASETITTLADTLRALPVWARWL